MKTTEYILFFSLIFSASCSSTPAPAWQEVAYEHLKNYIQSALAGEDRFAANHFDRAIAETAKTGDPTLMGRIFLTRCAIETAMLSATECAVDSLYLSDPENAAYHALLTGRQLIAANLPKRYRRFAVALEKRQMAEVAAALSDIDDPVSRLIAVGVAARHGFADGAILERGAATASMNGWQQPLIAYLLHLKRLYEAAGDTAGVSSVEARLEVIEQGKKSLRK